MSRIDDAIQAKLEKRQALEEQGIVAHPHSFSKKQTIAQVRDLEEDSQVQTAGRIMAKREHGKVVFLDLEDSTASIQLMIRQQAVGDEQFSLLELIDPGDFFGAMGKVVTTRTGELSILIEEFKFLGKALRPLPSEWNAAEDKEIRFRQRYLDLLVNKDARKVIDARWQIEKELRRYLQDEHQFVEVETPILQAIYGGTNARPFKTHMNALDSDFYLRIAPELYLKRLVVAGYEKVFEIARNFRNEGIDQTHQPEFTMVEWYEAYADYQRMMDVTEGLIKHLAKTVNNGLTVKVEADEIDLSGDWPRITMKQALQKYLDLDWDELDEEQIKELLAENEIELTGVYTNGKAMFAIFDKLVPEHLIQPTWVIDYPRDVSPLSKHHRDDETLAERFECYIGGKEIADGWSEIVDPVDQRQIFENEQQRMRAGDDEAHPLDEDYLKAMEYGMPPMGGIGVGVDRLVMFLTNTWNIREVIAFPTLRPLPQQTEWQQTSVARKSVKSAEIEANIDKSAEDNPLPSRQQTEKLLDKYIDSENLKNHCRLVAEAMEAYADKLGEDQELWYQTGLLHDLDWEKYPDEHPQKAVNEFLDDYPQVVRDAIEAHAPHITGKKPETQLERYLFACDELSGFMVAYALMRPKRFAGMKPSKVKKKLKDASFAANVSRDDIEMGFELIDEAADEHISFLVEVFDKSENI